jgi:hypothetical protein
VQEARRKGLREASREGLQKEPRNGLPEKLRLLRRMSREWLREVLQEVPRERLLLNDSSHSRSLETMQSSKLAFTCASDNSF